MAENDTRNPSAPYSTPKISIVPIGIDFDDENWVDDTEELLKTINERLISFDFSECSDKLDELKIAIHNGDHKITDMPQFVVGQKFLVSWGWPGEMCEAKPMIVVKREPGNPHIVWMRDPMLMLHQRKKYYHRSNITDSEFVRVLAEEWGYVGSVARITETTKRGEITQPKDRTDAEQIHRLARRNGFETYIDVRGFYWGPRNLDDAPIAEFIWRTDQDRGKILGEPRITQNTDRGAAQVILQFRDPKKKKTYTVKVSASSQEFTALGNEIELDDPDNSPGTKRTKRASRIVVKTGGYMEEDEAKTLAQAFYRDEVQGMYAIQLSIIGDPRIEAKRIFRLVEHSKTYDGLYYIREARHVITPGSYTVDITGERDALAEVRVAKKVQKTNSNRHQNEEENVIKDTDELERSLFITKNENGDEITAWTFKSEKDDPYVAKYGTQTSQLSGDELALLSDARLDQLYNEGVVSTLPDM